MPKPIIPEEVAPKNVVQLGNTQKTPSISSMPLKSALNEVKGMRIDSQANTREQRLRKERAEKNKQYEDSKIEEEIHRTLKDFSSGRQATYDNFVSAFCEIVGLLKMLQDRRQLDPESINNNISAALGEGFNQLSNLVKKKVGGSVFLAEKTGGKIPSFLRSSVQEMTANTSVTRPGKGQIDVTVNSTLSLDKDGSGTQKIGMDALYSHYLDTQGYEYKGGQWQTKAADPITGNPKSIDDIPNVEFQAMFTPEKLSKHFLSKEVAKAEYTPGSPTPFKTTP
ncbi:MAG: hypothetical protein Q8R79_08735 [Legionellaceae bacterium]|nr:hypothetical protein [Legionellaceae bacterium]